MRDNFISIEHCNEPFTGSESLQRMRMAKPDYFDEQSRKQFLISIKAEPPSDIRGILMVAIKSNLSCQDKKSIQDCHLMILNRIKKQNFVLNEKDSVVPLLRNELRVLWRK